METFHVKMESSCPLIYTGTNKKEKYICIFYFLKTLKVYIGKDLSMMWKPIYRERFDKIFKGDILDYVSKKMGIKFKKIPCEAHIYTSILPWWRDDDEKAD